MRTIFFLGLLTLTLQSQAYVVRVLPMAKEGQPFQQQISLQCTERDTLCSAVCNDPMKCISPEPLCVNCAGTSSTLLRTAFSRLTTYYKADTQVVPEKALVDYFYSHQFILLTPQSVYNFYQPWNDPGIFDQFDSLCPMGSINPTLLVTLNENNEPSELPFVFCQVAPGMTEAYAISQKVPNDVGNKSLANNQLQTPP